MLYVIWCNKPGVRSKMLNGVSVGCGRAGEIIELVILPTKVQTKHAPYLYQMLSVGDDCWRNNVECSYREFLKRLGDHMLQSYSKVIIQEVIEHNAQLDVA